jgi:hypothetical protein
VTPTASVEVQPPVAEQEPAIEATEIKTEPQQTEENKLSLVDDDVQMQDQEVEAQGIPAESLGDAKPESTTATSQPSTTQADSSTSISKSPQAKEPVNIPEKDEAPAQVVKQATEEATNNAGAAPEAVTAIAEVPVSAPSNVPDLSFDSMFNTSATDTKNTTDTDDLFGDMDFTVSNSEEQDLQFNQNSAGEIDLSSMFDAPQEGDANNNDNGTSLLPGLHNYTGADDNHDLDMFDLSMPDTNTNTEKKVGQSEQTAGENASGEMFSLGDSGNDLDMGLANESNFDDIFAGMDFGEGGEDIDNGEAMDAGGEFDNAFFELE